MGVIVPKDSSIFRGAGEACKTGWLVPRMRRLRGVAESLTYYLVCNQLASLFSSHCFALLPTHSRRSFCRIDRRRFRQSRGVLCWLRSSPCCCSRYRPNACLYIFIIASTSSSYWAQLHSMEGCTDWKRSLCSRTDITVFPSCLGSRRLRSCALFSSVYYSIFD